MARHLGIDFGTSNTVVARWDEVQRDGVPIHVQDFGRRLSYERERNDRQSATVTADRSRVLVRRTQPVNEKWDLTLAGAYRKSEHDRLPAGSDETLLELSATARRDLPAGWLLQTEIYLAENDSDVVLFAYDRSRFSLGVNKAF